MKKQITFPVSFVAHHMLVNKLHLAALKNEIELKNKNIWFEAILASLNKKHVSMFSEYELYGHYLLSNYPDEIFLEYWHNLIISRKNLTSAMAHPEKYSNRYKTLSFPYYY